MTAYESRIIHSVTFVPKYDTIGTATVELWIDFIGEESEYNVRTTSSRHLKEGSKFSEVKTMTVESHWSKKSAVATYNYELYVLGDPNYEGNKLTY